MQYTIEIIQLWDNTLNFNFDGCAKIQCILKGKTQIKNIYIYI